MSITVRPLTTQAECDHFQMVQRQIWGGDEEGIMPSHVLITLAHNGGMVMGAYADDGPPETGGMVGIVAGWLGSDTRPGENGPRLKFCSHMAGVLPHWQRQHVGLRLKIAQADWVRAQGLTDWVTWTYDPLYRANGVFNIHRLGATCSTYVRDLYGEMTDVLNAGGPSDRCKVDWWIESERVKAALQRTLHGDEAAPGVASAANVPAGLRVLPTQASGSLRQPIDQRPALDGAPLAIPIPEDIAALRRLDRALALEWRYFLRARLEEAFAADYAIVDCLHIPASGGREWCYVLIPQDSAT